MLSSLVLRHHHHGGGCAVKTRIAATRRWWTSSRTFTTTIHHPSTFSTMSHTMSVQRQFNSIKINDNPRMAMNHTSLSQRRSFSDDTTTTATFDLSGAFEVGTFLITVFFFAFNAVIPLF